MTPEQREWLETMAIVPEGSHPNSFNANRANAIRAALRDLDAAERVVEAARKRRDEWTPETLRELDAALAAYDAGSGAGREGET